jgi:hypothetical protein
MAGQGWFSFRRLGRWGVVTAIGLTAALLAWPAQAKDEKESDKSAVAIISRSVRTSNDKAAKEESRPLARPSVVNLKERVSPLFFGSPFGGKVTQAQSPARESRFGGAARSWAYPWQAAPSWRADAPAGLARGAEAKPSSAPSNVRSANPLYFLYGRIDRPNIEQKTATLPEPTKTGPPAGPGFGWVPKVVNPITDAQVKEVQLPNSRASFDRIGKSGGTDRGLPDSEKKINAKPYYGVYQSPVPTKAAGGGKPGAGWLGAAPSDKLGRPAAGGFEKQASVLPKEGKSFDVAEGKPAKLPAGKPVATPMGGIGQAKTPLVKPGLPPGSEKPLTPKVAAVPSGGQWLDKIHEQIIGKNKGGGKGTWTLPGPSVIVKPDGEKVAPIVVDRGSRPRIGGSFSVIRSRFGHPFFGYTFIPRPVTAFSIGYNLGFRDGFSLGLHYGVPSYRHVRPVFLRFYFGYYFDDPFFAGFWYPGYYPSVYSYFGWVPRWCLAPSIVLYEADPYPIYVGPPVYYYMTSLRLDEEGVSGAMADIRRAWLDSDIDRLAYYLREEGKVSVYFDGSYCYSVSRDDYYTMTLDAISTVKTVEMDFDGPIWLSRSEVFFTGRHIFYNPDNERQIVYVSYRLHRYAGHWSIIAVGSSPKPIGHEYHDFRYWE